MYPSRKDTLVLAHKPLKGTECILNSSLVLSACSEVQELEELITQLQNYVLVQ